MSETEYEDTSKYAKLSNINTARNVCARRDNDIHQRMNAHGLSHMIYSPETEADKTMRYVKTTS
jgi:hypothetical protein